ncbi:MAG: TetR/AcrR family transcriptional regulator [Holophaga sp.]|nr:TetR/AcrR family transcriptional regulator [Holophaga sp.]
MKLTQCEKSERSRGAILQAALQLFSKQGYRGTSIREIATAADLSTGNVYHHFPDKEALFTTLLDQYWEAIDSPEFPFNQALAAGAFPDDLEALARATEESVRTYRPYVALIYVDVVELEGTHIRKFYAGMSERFTTFMNQRFPGDALKDRLAPGFHPNTALMLASRVFLHYFAVEILFGVPHQFGLDTPTAMGEISRIFRTGMLRPDSPSHSKR